MSLTVAQSAAVVGELRRARRKQRVAAIHWIDALYQVYVTGLVAVVAIVLISGATGDGDVTGSALDDVTRNGPAVLGVLVALAVAMGLRSGSRGGPLALEKADVRHVLLSPVDRGVALRGPAWRQLRFLLAVGAGVGATSGQLAVRRLPGNPLGWIAAGALFGVVVIGITYGCALVASGVGVKSWISSVIGGLLLAWSVGDITGDLPTSPASVIGGLALWPLEADPLGLIGVALAAALLAAGFRWVAGTSLEAAERRTALVGQMRFAVTLQDLRTVLVLRRQLAQENPRAKPWIPAMVRTPRYAVWQRGLRSTFRWPVSRLVRVVLMAVVAGLSLRAVWSGTTPLIVVAGLALWIAALDAAEPLGQEVDHPGRTDAFPVIRGEIFLKHLPIALVVSGAVGLLAGAIASAPFGDGAPVGPALVVGLVAGLLAAGGAAISVVQGAPEPVDNLSMVTPEIAGARTLMRTTLPPAVAILGTLPILAARAAEEGVSDPPPMSAAVNVSIMLVAVLVLIGGWIRFRDDIKKWMADAADQMSPTKAVERQREERLAEEEREAAVLAESRRIAEGSASQRAKARQPKSTQSNKVTPTPEGAQGGTSAKPIGRRRDQK